MKNAQETKTQNTVGNETNDTVKGQVKLSEKYAGDPREPWEIKRDELNKNKKGCYTPAVG